MNTTNAASTFAGLSYWLRLPGFAAFCGVAIGVCAARRSLALAPDIAPQSTIYIMPLFSAILFFTVAGILQKRQIFRVVFFAVSGAALFASSELGARAFYNNMEGLGEYNQIMTLRVRISSPVSRAYSGYRFRASVAGADDARVAAALSGRTLQCVSRAPAPPYGEVTVQGRYAPPRRAAGPFGFDQREHFAVNNIHGSFNVSRILTDDKGWARAAGPASLPERASPAARLPLAKLLSPEHVSYKLRKHVQEVIGRASSQDARGILHAAFLGEKEQLPAGLNLAFRRSGIIHLLAISGFHAALLYSAVFAALGLIGLPARTRTFISLAALWGYLFFIGFMPSLFRATVMVTFFCLSMTLQRKNHAVHSLGFAGACWLYISPHSLFAPGFQLSFAATAGIIMLQPVFGGVTKIIVDGTGGKYAKFIAGKALSPFWVSVAGFAATAPPLLHHFGTLSLYGIFFNLIAIPIMSAAMWVFFAAVVLSSAAALPLAGPPIGFISGAAVWCSEKMLDALVFLAGLSGRVSFSEIVVPHTAAVQLAVMVIFMAGLCAARPDLRAAFAARAGAAAALVIAASALYLSMTVKTENLAFARNASAANVVIHKDNTAWIAAKGTRFDIRQLREREIEPLLQRKKIKGVPLFVINEEAEEEAHEFTFVTDFTPRVISVRRYKGGGGQDENNFYDDAYVMLDARQFISSNGACSLSISDDGDIVIVVGH